jgi:hypothetical protein
VTRGWRHLRTESKAANIPQYPKSGDVRILHRCFGRRCSYSPRGLSLEGWCAEWSAGLGEPWEPFSLSLSFSFSLCFSLSFCLSVCLSVSLSLSRLLACSLARSCSLWETTRQSRLTRNKLALSLIHTHTEVGDSSPSRLMSADDEEGGDGR